MNVTLNARRPDPADVGRIQSVTPTCVEWRRPWLESAERWRAYLTVDDETALLCPACAERELGDS